MSRRRTPLGERLAAVLAAAVLIALFAVNRDPLYQSVFLDWRPAPEALALIAAVSLAGWPRRFRGALLFALGVVAVALVHWADSLIPALLGRELALVFDLPHVPSVWAMATDAAGPATSLLALLGIAAVLLAVILLVAVALRQVARPRVRPEALTIALAGGLALAVLWPHETDDVPLAFRSIDTAARQTAWAVSGWRASGTVLAEAAAAPDDDLAGLGGRDVYLVFLESYGTVALDHAALRRDVEPVLTAFERDALAGGYAIASSRIESPTYGGASWLAHGTLASGVRLGDQFAYNLLLRSGRRTMAHVFAAAGYRTLNVLPGLKSAWDAARFWGFAETADAEAMRYPGPQFGWFEVPDQYTLDWTWRRVKDHAGPIFAQLVLVSTHFPFHPIPPVLDDWERVAAWPAEARPEPGAPDWRRLDRSYADALAYEFAVLGGWLARLDRDALVVILGDHQPPAFAIDAGRQPWTVPIHVLARDPALLQPFRALGYVAGAVPASAGPVRRMEDFFGDVLRGFSAAESKRQVSDAR